MSAIGWDDETPAQSPVQHVARAKDALAELDSQTGLDPVALGVKAIAHAVTAMADQEIRAATAHAEQAARWEAVASGDPDKPLG